MGIAPRSRPLKNVALAFCLLASPALADGAGGKVADGFARPALQELAAAGAKLTVAAQGLCAAPGEETLQATRALFGEAVAAFGRASVLRFGPLAADNRFERLFFWPDPRGIALKQVQGALAQKDESLADPAQVAGKSVALQGLPALEFALFGTGSDELEQAPVGFRCRFAAAVAANVAFIAEDVAAGWATGTPFAQSFTDPQAGREPYRSHAEVDGEIVKALATAFQFIRAAELLPPLGESAEKANGRRAPLWRSDLSFPLMIAQVEGARDLLLAAGYGESLPADSNWLPGQIRFELQAAIRALGEIATPAEKAFGEERDREQIAFANVALDGAGHDVSEKLAAALGLVMGFNALDGD